MNVQVVKAKAIKRKRMPERCKKVSALTARHLHRGVLRKKRSTHYRGRISAARRASRNEQRQ